MSAAREKARFASEGTECAAWHYPGTNGACVVMAGGGAVTKEPGTDPFAKRFHEAGFSVLAFDYRRLGESGGRPGGHYEPFLGGHERAVEAELAFLRRHLLDRTRAAAILPADPR
jgi:alpha-beta hydrolase superfamily lysophospholipase